LLIETCTLVQVVRSTWFGAIVAPAVVPSDQELPGIWPGDSPETHAPYLLFITWSANWPHKIGLNPLWNQGVHNYMTYLTWDIRLSYCD
jgi:hypothetical protein